MSVSFPRVIQDTREQMPWTFPDDVDVARSALPAGDYSLEGFETEIAIERKSLPDFVACCTQQRDRFERELVKLGSYDFAVVIVEAEMESVWRRDYRSQAHPASIIGSAAAWTIDYAPVVFAGDAVRAADLALRFLRRWHSRRTRKVAA